ncbi:MAG: hypothetical protein QM737_22745 [Ferruginibacter sp.]
MDKDKLRPVQIKSAINKPKIGWFHKWFTIVDEYQSEHVLAIIENEDGKLINLGPEDFHFTDRK